MKKILFLFPLVLLLVILFSTEVSAQGIFSSDLYDPLGGSFDEGGLGGVITKVLPFVFSIAGVLSFGFLIWGGFKYMAARGDPKTIDSARNTIVGAIIGLIIILSAVAIMILLGDVLRINIFGGVISPVYAQVNIGENFLLGEKGISSVFENPGEIFTLIFSIAIGLAGLVFFAFLMWGGLRYMTSRGDDKLIVESRQTISNSVIGLLLIISSIAIIKIIETIFGTDLFPF